MPRVDLTLFNARIFDVNSFQVIVGQQFTLSSDITVETKWFSDNDPVLGIKVTGNNAEVEALQEGTCTILIMDAKKNIQKELTITVHTNLPVPADVLEVSAETPIQK